MKIENWNLKYDNNWELRFKNWEMKKNIWEVRFENEEKRSVKIWGVGFHLLLIVTSFYKIL